MTSEQLAHQLTQAIAKAILKAINQIDAIPIYQLKDEDGENVGLVKTDIPEKELEEAWKSFNDVDRDEYFDVDPFVSALQKGHSDAYIERIYVNDINP